MSADRLNVIVVGGGIIGCCTAYYLARAGVRVTLLERGPLCSEASSANAGLVSVSTREGLQLAMARESVRLLLELRDETESDFEFVQAGNLILLRTNEDLEKHQANVEKPRAVGLDLRLLDRESALELEPEVARKILGAVYSPLDYTVNPYALTLAFAKAARREGADLRTGVEVTGLKADGSRVRGALTSCGEFAGDVVVVAAGAWSPALLRTVGMDLPVEPSRGQIVATEPLPVITRRIVRDTGHIYVRRTARGNYVIGSLTERVGFDKSLTPEKLRDYVKEGATLIPALRDVKVLRAWAGLRPLSPDNLPFLGPMPGYDGLVLATGHSRTGVGFSAVTGRMVADQIATGKTAFPMEPFSVTRL